MKAAKLFFHPLCPGKYLIVVIDTSDLLWVKCYEVSPTGITETEGKRLRRLLSKRVKEWKARVDALTPAYGLT